MIAPYADRRAGSTALPGAPVRLRPGSERGVHGLENYKGRRPGCAVCPYALDAVLFFGCSVGVNQTMTEERGAAAISIATNALIGRT
jgi:hypothetical protein